MIGKDGKQGIRMHDVLNRRRWCTSRPRSSPSSSPSSVAGALPDAERTQTRRRASHAPEPPALPDIAWSWAASWANCNHFT
eukprot:scaffold226539_cov19-Prasinocladus_malaysianus.AAC.1